MRLVRSAGPALLRMGRGRATRYGWRQVWPGLDSSRFPVVRVTAEGHAVPAGEIVTLAARESVWLPEAAVTAGLPVAVADARPAGFLGRHFAAIHADLRLPSRPDEWSDHHTLIAIARRGEDLPGDLIVGEESFGRWQVIEPVPHTRDEYAALASAAMAGRPPGSSAGGERPKFGVMVEGEHILVKFAARGGAGDLVARRWCDLLVLEALALDIVGSHGIAVPRTALVETPTHWCLESARFDRVGPRGRRAVLSLAAVHDEAADGWTRAARALLDAGRIDEEDARRLRWLDAFGALIGNTDRHQHNVVFFTDGPHLRLAPAFDQVSMFYAPAADGLVPSRTFAVPHATADVLDVWEDARAAAREFWVRAGDDVRVSDGLRLACASNARALTTAAST
jgi:hypothetical protein